MSPPVGTRSVRYSHVCRAARVWTVVDGTSATVAVPEMATLGVPATWTPPMTLTGTASFGARFSTQTRACVATPGRSWLGAASIAPAVNPMQVANMKANFMSITPSSAQRYRLDWDGPVSVSGHPLRTQPRLLSPAGLRLRRPRHARRVWLHLASGVMLPPLRRGEWYPACLVNADVRQHTRGRGRDTWPTSATQTTTSRTMTPRA